MYVYVHVCVYIYIYIYIHMSSPCGPQCRKRGQRPGQMAKVVRREAGLIPVSVRVCEKR